MIYEFIENLLRKVARMSLRDFVILIVRLYLLALVCMVLGGIIELFF